jgi:RNA polymerase sigma-70 factor, ECF subfamily
VESDAGNITRLLHDWQTGDPQAESQLFEMLVPDLRQMARRYFQREREGHTLQPTALVNEAFLRLVRARNLDWQDRGHFLAVAARVMRRCLIDHARSRPDAAIVPMDGVPEAVLGSRSPLDWAIAIDTLLDELARLSPQQRSVVELKFYLGFTDDEAASALNLTVRTFQREWFLARRWLFERLTAPPCKPANTTPHNG